MNPSQHPYGDWASAYWVAGWRGVLPLPPGQKTPPPEGYTGAGGAWPSYADVHAWAEERPNANLGIRLPPDVIGMDVDTYGGKRGAETIGNAVAAYGELPPTFSSTSRAEGSGSGIFLFRVPPGLRWPGEVGPHVEIIQTRHRYMVAPPSRHPTGRDYQWYAALGIPLPLGDRIPSPDKIPDLPEAWINGLTAGRSVSDAGDVEKVDITDADVTTWWRANRQHAPCRIMFARLTRVLDDLVTGQGSRHDIALRGVMAFAHLSREGHTGASHAATELGKAWALQVQAPGEGARSHDAALAEWSRMLAGAVAMSAAYGDPGAQPDPCNATAAHSFVENDATLAEGYREPETLGGQQIPGQGGVTQSPSAPLHSPAAQGGDGTIPPLWVTGQNDDDTGGRFPGVIAPRSGDSPDLSEAQAITATEPAGWDRRAAAVALEVERLEVRRDARLEMVRAEHLKFWREPPGYSLREALLLPDVPPQWRVLDVMPEGSNVLLTAQYKTGKTTLINELTKAVADGNEFLGRFKIPHTTNVALFNYEVGEAQYLRWLRDRGINNADGVHVFNLRGFTLPLSVPLVRDFITEWLRVRRIGVWIVDPFARAFSGGGDENNNADVAPFLEILDGIKEASGVTELIMPTHTGRAEFAQGAERARGATRLDDWCDVRWLLVKDDEGNRYFRATGRDVETEETRLEFDPLTRALTLGSGARPPKASRSNGRGDWGAQGGAQGQSAVVEDILLEVCADEPGSTMRQIRAESRRRGVSVGNVRLAEGAKRLAQQGRLRIETTPLANGKSVSRHWAVGPVDHAGEPE